MCARARVFGRRYRLLYATLAGEKCGVVFACSGGQAEWCGTFSRVHRRRPRSQMRFWWLHAPTGKAGAPRGERLSDGRMGHK